MRKNILTKEFIQSQSLPDSISGCWNWQGYRQSSGYGQFRLDGKSVTAHRMAWQLWNDQLIPNELLVCHRCDNPRCVNPAHLFLGSHSDNMQDCATKKRLSSSGTRVKRKRKLTDDQVREIRATRYNKEPLAAIAARYGVSSSCVSIIRRGLRKQLVA